MKENSNEAISAFIKKYPISKLLVDTDIDGVFCGAIAKRVFPNAEIFLGDATAMNKHVFDDIIDEHTLIADLKFVKGAGLYFDHHEGNIDEGQAYEGKFELLESATHVMYDYFKDIENLDEISSILPEIDKFDSGNITLEEYLEPSDVFKLAVSIFRFDKEFIMKLILALSEKPFQTVYQEDFVQEKVNSTFSKRQQIYDYVKKNAFVWQNFVFVDVSDYPGKEKINSFLVSSQFPEVEGTVIFKKEARFKGIKVRFYANNFNKNRKDINYLEIAKSLSPNAGGHKGACGYLLPENVSIEEAVEGIKVLLRKIR